MKRLVWLVIVACVVAGGVVVWKRTEQAAAGYASYVSTRLKVQLQYPAGWRLMELEKPQGRQMGEVQIFGPRSQDLQYSPYLDVTAEGAATPSGVVPTLADAVQAVVLRRLRQRTYQTAGQADVRCAGAPAIRVVANYELRLPVQSAKPKTVAFREVNCYVLRGSQLYILTYAAPAEDAPKHQVAFEHLVKTLKFVP